MPKKGPIIIVEDDLEDQDDIATVFNVLDISNELKFFGNGKEALQFLLTSPQQPFLILCDINMPEMNGLELRQEICKSDYLKIKSIPFIILSTSSSRESLQQAYALTVQGYFKKGDTFESLKRDLERIVDYWSACRHPNAN